MSQNVHVLVEHLRGHVAEITYVALAAARRLAQHIGGDVVAVLLGDGAEGLAVDLNADRVLYVADPRLGEYTPEPYIAVLAHLLGQDPPHVVLMGDTSIGAEVASGLSGRMTWPLVSRCHHFDTAAEGTRFVSQICGGKILAVGPLPGSSTLVTMVPGGYLPEVGKRAEAPELLAVPAPPLEEGRISFRDYCEPAAGDVDISVEPILIAVGRGIEREENLKLAEDLAAALGGVVCASRPVVDQGWLPTTRLVGRSGMRVKPKVYLALGISGAPEHVEGIAGTPLMIAVNTDLTAPIFDVARYGAEVDILDLLPALLDLLPDADTGPSG